MKRRTFIGLVAAFFFLAACVWGQRLQKPPVRVDRQVETVTLQADVLRFFSFGLKRAIADLTWIQTLLEGDLEHYTKGDLNSWMYLRFLSIVSIDPRFYEAYRYGGQYLMIVKDDLLGADDLMKRGLALFPDDYHLNWQMGYLHAIERGDVTTSFPYFERIKSRPERPLFFDSFYTKVVAQSLGTEEALALATELWRQYPDGDPTKERLEEHIYSLKGQTDLACLNGGGPACDRSDFRGRPYRRDADGKWSAVDKIFEMKLKNPRKE